MAEMPSFLMLFNFDKKMSDKFVIATAVSLLSAKSGFSSDEERASTSFLALETASSSHVL